MAADHFEASSPETTPALAPGAGTTVDTTPDATTPLPENPAADGGANDTEGYDEAADMARALAAFAGVKPKTEEKTAAAPATTTEPAAAPKKDEPKAEETKLDHVLNRISRLESERDDARKEIETHRANAAKYEAAAKRAAEYEAEFAAAEEDPERLFKRIKWNPEKVTEFLTHGPKKIAPEVKEMQEKLARLEQFEKAETERRTGSEREARIVNFKKTIPDAVPADKYPLLHRLHDGSSSALADEVWGVMLSAYQNQKREVTVDEAASTLESILSTQLQRLTKANSEKPAVPTTPAQAPKQSKPTLTNEPPTSPSTTQSADEDDDEAAFNKALATMRRARQAQ